LTVRRRAVLSGIGACAVLAAVPAAVVATRGAASTPPPSPPAAATVTVERRDLVERADVAGTLGYGDAHAVAVSGPGTVTALPAAGATVDRGQPIAEIDGHPVTLLFGTRPMWRRLDASSAPGPDIAQLEENLVALGYATADALGPDDTWTWATTRAVKAWQHDLGGRTTGAVEPGQVVFEPGAVRVAEAVAAVGAPAGGPAVKVTGTTRTVSVDLPAPRRSLVHTGDAVQVKLPDGRTVDGTVATVGSVARAAASGQGDATIAMTVSLADAAAVGALDQAPVTVRITTTAATGVLAVPVQALLAVAEGGYALERPDGTLVPVTLGASVDGWVEVRGAVQAGERVGSAR
jgi:hypothetical protein